jgi:hypothetical protein
MIWNIAGHHLECYPPPMCIIGFDSYRYDHLAMYLMIIYLTNTRLRKMSNSELKCHAGIVECYEVHAKTMLDIL